MNKKLENQKPELGPPDEMDAGRREAPKKLGVYGAYTAPALYALLHSDKAVATSNGQGQNGNGQGQNGQR